MAAKNQKVSLKSLQAEVMLYRDEFEATKKELIEVKEELKVVKEEVRCLKVSEKIEKPENNWKCDKCDKSFSLKKNLKIHNLEYHKQTIKCKLCPETFELNCDLEVHVKRNHVSEEKFDCDICGKSFALEWRMKKHKQIHTNQTLKRCHYFNNDKSCPFEEIGCMFEHSFAGICRYGGKCNKTLCSYQHKKGEKDMIVDGINDNLETLTSVFEMLSKDEKFESREVLCDYICAAPYGYHKCFSNEDYERFAEFDLTNFEDEYDPVRRITVDHFPCKNCDNIFEDEDKLKSHFNDNHDKIDNIKCPINCNYETKSVDTLVMHIGVKHQEEVQRKLN